MGKYILDAGMTCVFCIGEPKEIREKGLDAVLAEMDVQLEKIYALLDAEKVVIAYEPVWAIGTGLTATLRTHRPPASSTAALPMPRTRPICRPCQTLTVFLSAG